jgi:hypothetical protein
MLFAYDWRLDIKVVTLVRKADTAFCSSNFLQKQGTQLAGGAGPVLPIRQYRHCA